MKMPALELAGSSWDAPTTNMIFPTKIQRRSARLGSLLLAVVLSCLPSFAQSLDGVARGQAKDMLNSVKDQIKDNYYDSKYGGVDIETRFKAAEAKLEKAASLGQAFGIIAQAVIDINDSHTKFYPPPTTVAVEYGWRLQMVGNKCFITAVKPGSDAEKQGLKPGDEVLSIEGFKPHRKELWKINYYYNVISPRQGLSLVVLSPTGEQKTLNLASKLNNKPAVKTLEEVIRSYELSEGRGSTHHFLKVGNATIWKMPNFLLDPSDVDEIMTGRAVQSQNLILDLRGNGGGYVLALEALAGYFVDSDTKIADLKGRKPMKPQMARSRGSKVYRGKLVVLVDSRSGSASEIFARFVQINGRGVVIGDQSAGAVMQSRGVPMSLGVNSIVPYGMNLTNADVIMSDGVSLEHTGVTPQLTILPSPADLASNADPALAAALTLLGNETSPVTAGKLLPKKWEDD
jgi:C-terminal processing protease CtpA/Prc